MAGQFFALFSRMKNINRWALMRNTRSESLSQHSLEVAATAHALALIGVKRLPLMLFGAFSLAGALMLALLLRKSEKNAGQKPRRGKRAGKAKKA